MFQLSVVKWGCHRGSPKVYCGNQTPNSQGCWKEQELKDVETLSSAIRVLDIIIVIIVTYFPNPNWTTWYERGFLCHFQGREAVCKMCFGCQNIEILALLMVCGNNDKIFEIVAVQWNLWCVITVIMIFLCEMCLISCVSRSSLISHSLSAEGTLRDCTNVSCCRSPWEILGEDFGETNFTISVRTVAWPFIEHPYLKNFSALNSYHLNFLVEKLENPYGP